MKKILITGHLGLVGRGVCPLLAQKGYQLLGFDKANDSGDITHSSNISKALKGCHGVIHLAAVSRVIWGEQHPDICWQTNATASKNLLNLAANSPIKPWVIVASSREVYGEQKTLPFTKRHQFMCHTIQTERQYQC